MKIDIGTALKFVFDDPQWLKKCAIMGLILFLPVIGIIITFGWQKRIFDQVRAGQPVPLPDIDLMGDAARGMIPFIAVLNLVVPAFVLAIASALLAFVANYIDQSMGAIVGLICNVGLVVIMLPLSLLFPELLRRAFADDDKFPLLKIAGCIKILTADPSTYAILILGWWAASFVQGLGGFACLVGAVITNPWGLASQAHLLSQYDAAVNPRPLVPPTAAQPANPWAHYGKMPR